MTVELGKSEGKEVVEVRRQQPVTGITVVIHPAGEWDIDGKKVPYPAGVDIIQGKQKIKTSAIGFNFILKSIDDKDFKRSLDLLGAEERALLGI